jgi:GT2 family glycosyltransferase
MRNSQPPVAIIITAWNQAELTADCLASLGQPASAMIVLVDNGSDPPLQPILHPRFPHIEFLRNEENLGFAGGYNTGLRYALAQGYAYLFLLNNDTIVDTACIDELLKACRANPRLGLIMPKIYYASEPTRIWSVGANYRPWLGELRDDWRGEWDSARTAQPRLIEFAPLCAAFIPRPVLEEVGLLDEQFFLYYEDLDFCQRLGEVGYQLQMVPTAKVWHKVSASTGGWHSPLERFWIAQSSGRYFRRHGAGWRMALVLPYRLASGMRLSLLLIWRRQWRPLGAYWLGLCYGWLGQHARTAPPTWVTK